MLIFTGINMALGDILRIDTDKKTVTLNGINVVDKLPKDADFFRLANGENHIKVTGDDGADTAAIKILHRDRWV